MWKTLNPCTVCTKTGSKICKAVEVDMPAQTRGRLDGMWVVSGGGGGHLAGGQGRPRGTRGILSGCPLKPRQPKNLKTNPRANKSFLFIAKNIAKSPVNKKLASSKMRSIRDQDIPSYKIAFPPHRLDTYYPNKFTACTSSFSPLRHLSNVFKGSF